MTQKILHKAESRGHLNHGWLDTYHSFSFGSYYNPENINFGALRVLNDDRIAARSGFGTHPHENIEIITIPISGQLTHIDSMGNTSIIKQGEIQVMSAGSGITHSEYNYEDSMLELFQIWILPNKHGVEPRYNQIDLATIKKNNELFQILSPNPDDQGVWIHQNAWFHIGFLDKDLSRTYSLKNKDNGTYTFLIDGKAEVEGELLTKRDALGIIDTESIEIKTKANSHILIIEVPLI